MIFTLFVAMSRIGSTSLTIYLLLLHVLIVLLVSGRGRRFVSILRQQDEVLKNTNFQSQMRTFHRRVDEMAPPGSVLFIGASGIQGMDVSQICDKALNLGIGGDTTDGVLQRLTTYSSLKTARAIVLSIGYNDLNISSDSHIIANFRKIIQSIPEQVPLLVCSLIEIDEKIIGQEFNERVNRLNPILLNLCKQRDRTEFLDLHKALLQKFQGRHEGYLESDGCHLNLPGRRIWIESLKLILNSMG